MLSFSTLSSLAMPTSGSATPTSSLQRRNSLKSELLFLDSPQPTSELGTRIKAELSKKRSLQNLRRGNSVKSDNTFLRTTPSPSLQRGSSLKADMKAMLDDDKYFDVVFVCADGAEVRGSRAILSARSDTLDHLLLRSTGKRDSAPAKIHLPEITSRSFRVVLRCPAHPSAPSDPAP
ncbi:hypothetical protein BC936DRAFT_142448 [Jimgerdemannia flammicorona]|uniref:Uncharacterized protein n=2 Tax=Jimgerdemannia flammicorona TaxID=994334 RepID=A0A433QPT4_9FUNG|nr:hypothetical protein BC936DRAFT_142448 [Jimgerdemannia flammicorona]RUS31803.1 hypothetical protein BC938DRAFT_477023 [Jimgerdemannia flammicorona]